MTDAATVSPTHQHTLHTFSPSTSLQVSRRSSLNLTEFVTPNDLKDLDQDVLEALMGGTTLTVQGLQISHV